MQAELLDYISDRFRCLESRLHSVELQLYLTRTQFFLHLKNCQLGAPSAFPSPPLEFPTPNPSAIDPSIALSRGRPTSPQGVCYPPPLLLHRAWPHAQNSTDFGTLGTELRHNSWPATCTVDTPESLDSPLESLHTRSTSGVISEHNNRSAFSEILPTVTALSQSNPGIEGDSTKSCGLDTALGCVRGEYFIGQGITCNATLGKDAEVRIASNNESPLDLTKSILNETECEQPLDPTSNEHLPGNTSGLTYAASMSVIGNSSGGFDNWPSTAGPLDLSASKKGSSSPDLKNAECSATRDWVASPTLSEDSLSPYVPPTLSPAIEQPSAAHIQDMPTQNMPILHPCPTINPSISGNCSPQMQPGIHVTDTPNRDAALVEPIDEIVHMPTISFPVPPSNIADIDGPKANKLVVKIKLSPPKHKSKKHSPTSTVNERPKKIRRRRRTRKQKANQIASLPRSIEDFYSQSKSNSDRLPDEAPVFPQQFTDCQKSQQIKCEIPSSSEITPQPSSPAVFPSNGTCLPALSWTPRTLQCSVCNSRFSRKRSLQKHMSLVHGTEVESQQNSNLTSDILDSDFVTETENHSDSKTAQKLQPKKKENASSAPRCCKYCGLRYSAAYLKAHVRTQHMAERPFRCETCPRSFAQAAHLKIHLHGAHRGKPPEVETRESQENVDQISSGHTNPKTDAEKSQLDAENLSSHVPASGKSFSCEYCGFTFAFRCFLKKHIHAKHRRIQRVACEICGRLFFDQLGVAVHQSKMHSRDERKLTLNIP